MSTTETNVMIDFETYGVRPNAVILSLGMVVVEDPKIFFYEAPSREDQNHRSTDESTLAWWSTQTISPPRPTCSYNEFCDLVHNWLCSLSGDIILWANGSDFDIPILNSVYKDSGRLSPWKYNNVRDYRTFRKVFYEVPVTPFQGTKHNALDDARNQAEHLKDILTYIEGRRDVI